MNVNDFPDAKLTLPVIAAPMFLISGPELVLECCKSGIIGTFPALNQRSSEGFEQWLIQIKEELFNFHKETGVQPAPFGVNLIVHQTNPRIEKDLKLCIKHKVPLIITSLGAISDIVNAVHSYGGKVYHDVIKRRHAEKASEAGVDGLILVCAGAGGHAGILNPMPFVKEVKEFFKKTIVVAGSITDGQDIATVMQMGANLAYMGTRFINTKESMAPWEYQQMINESGTSDIVYTSAISGVYANFLLKSLEKNSISEEMWNSVKKIDFGKELSQHESEAKAWSTIWSAGHGVAGISKTIEVQELVKELSIGFRSAIKKQHSLLS